jgi:protein-tyrosine phosphatase
MDDGAASLREAVRMAADAVACGITAVAATPHFFTPSDPGSFYRERDAAVEALRSALREAEIPLQVYPGAEVRPDEDFAYAPALRAAALGGSRYLLLELPFRRLTALQVMGIADSARERGYRPVFAHPERYTLFHRDTNIVNELADQGVYFQVTAQTLAGFGTKEECRFAAALCRANMAQFLSSDGHGARERRLTIASYEVLRQAGISRKQYEFMTDTAPQCVLSDKSLPARQAVFL